MTVRWSQTSPTGACYRLLPDSVADESCGWANDHPPDGGFAGDTSYSWTIHFGPNSQRNCIKYWISAEQCDSVPATFYLASALAVDSFGAVDSLAIQNRATILGGASDGVVWAHVDSIFPNHVAGDLPSALIVFGDHLRPGTKLILTSPAITLQASRVQVEDEHTLNAVFNVPRQAVGPFDVVVSSPDGSADRIEDAVDVLDVRAYMRPEGGTPVPEWPNTAQSLEATQDLCPEPFASCSYADTNGTSVIQGAGCDVPASVTNTRGLIYYFGYSVPTPNCPVGFKLTVV